MFPKGKLKKLKRWFWVSSVVFCFYLMYFYAESQAVWIIPLFLFVIFFYLLRQSLDLLNQIELSLNRRDSHNQLVKFYRNFVRCHHMRGQMLSLAFNSQKERRRIFRR